MKILQEGFEDAVRGKMGVSASELPDSIINQRTVRDLAESVVIKRVPHYEELEDPVDLINLENAVISYICYLLCPGMANRIRVEVTTLDVRWKKGRVDWNVMAQEFLAEMERSLLELESSADSTIFTVIKGGLNPIGGGE